MATDLGTLLVRVGITGVKDVTQSLHQVGDAAKDASQQVAKIDQAARGAGSGMGILGHAMSSFLGNIAAMGMGAVVGGLSNMVGTGLHLAQEWEAAAASLEGMGYTAEEVKRKFEYLGKVAAPSLYSKSQLIEMTKLLEAYGIKAEGTILSLAKLASAFGSNREQMLMLVRIIGRLSQGQRPEIEAMSAFGMKMEDLAAYGAKFSPKGESLSGGDVLVPAFLNMIEDRYGKMFDKMQNTTRARLSYLVDMWESASVKIANVFLTHVAPAVDAIAGWLRYFSESGFLTDFAERMAKVFDMDLTNAVDNAMAKIMNFMDNLPRAMMILKSNLAPLGEFIRDLFASLANDMRIVAAILGFLAGQTLGKALVVLIDVFIQLANSMKSVGVAAAALAVMSKNWQAIVAGLAGVAGAVAAFYAADKFLGAPKKALEISGLMDDTGVGPGAVVQALYQHMDAGSKKGYKDRIAEYKKWTKEHEPGMPIQSRQWRNKLGSKVTEDVAKTATATRATAKSTREMADAFRDIRTTILGGGPRTRDAVSSIEAQIALARALGYGIG